ncbi:MAG: hypothetical protein GXO45_02760 [Aquificae bacterium]|nr:hypothetical protein [Aquificota bacterium]
MKLKRYIVEGLQEVWVKMQQDFGGKGIILSIKDIGGKFEILCASTEDTDIPVKGVKAEQIADIKTDHPIALKIQEEINRVYTHILKKIQQGKLQPQVEENPFTKRFINIFGGVGSGKTTTLVKVASILKFTKGRSVALATFDYFKIEGSQTLNKFAEIMQVPFFMITGEKDLLEYQKTFTEFDHILFDTPGNLQELTEVETLLEVVSNGLEVENILAVSLAKRETLTDKEIDYFSKFNINHLILTHFDLMENEIPLYFVVANYPYKISYITNGANVPKDIIPAQKVINRIVEVGEK